MQVWKDINRADNLSIGIANIVDKADKIEVFESISIEDKSWIDNPGKGIADIIDKTDIPKKPLLMTTTTIWYPTIQNWSIFCL